MELYKYELKITFSEKYNLFPPPKISRNPTVEVKITGDQGSSSPWTKLTRENGARQKYIVNVLDVGEPVLIAIRMHGCCIGVGSAKYCNEVVITYKYKTFKFPVFDWVFKKEITAAEGGGKLPQNINNQNVKDARAAEIDELKSIFEWAAKPVDDKEQSWGINRYVSGKLLDYPALSQVFKCLGGSKNEKFPWLFLMSTKRLEDFLANNFEGILNQKTRDCCKGGDTTLTKLDDFRELYSTFGYGDPFFIDDWKQDREMGRQVLTGIAPLALYQCKEIPEGCNINNDVVGSLFDEGKTLESEMEAGKIYIGDFSYMKSLPRNTSAAKKPLHCANSFGLFHSKSDEEFIPLAIQLVPDNEDYVFTSKDSEADWLLAKMYFRNSLANRHQWVFHYLLTHGISETFAVATFRNLPRAHPIYKLLRPHLVTVASINALARLFLLPEGTNANNSMSLDAISSIREGYKTFKFDDLDIPKVLKERGLDTVPNNSYSEDTLEIWKALSTYVDQMVKHFYLSDTDIVEDYELQEWVNDIAWEGIAWQDRDTRGFPEKLETVEQLVKLCTVIIYTSSAQHAAVNFGQFNTYRFVPNAPGAMALPPHQKGQGSLGRILESLPDLDSSTGMLSLAFALSEFSEEDVFLSDFIDKLFVEIDVLEIQSNFKAEASRLQFKFMRRNQKLRFPYTYLLPNEIPISIAI